MRYRGGIRTDFSSFFFVSALFSSFSLFFLPFRSFFFLFATPSCCVGGVGQAGLLSCCSHSYLSVSLLWWWWVGVNVLHVGAQELPGPVNVHYLQLEAV